ncbi:YAP1 [Sanghuangporus sanghuang]
MIDPREEGAVRVSLDRPSTCTHQHRLSPSHSRRPTSIFFSTSTLFLSLLSFQGFRSRHERSREQTEKPTPNLLTEQGWEKDLRQFLSLLNRPRRQQQQFSSGAVLLTHTHNVTPQSVPVQSTSSCDSPVDVMDNLSAAPLWDLSLPPSLPALADEEFIALLQKQFGVNNGGFPATALDDDKEVQPPATNINPQNLTRIPIPRPADSPSSDDSSPSPNEPGTSRSRRQSGVFDMGNETPDDDPTLKRKADEEDLDNEPSPKTQHTSTHKKSSSTSRRKSTGNPSADESRLLKRKEQNRAAQRAFRERKEKHVKDLEDKVASLEEKNATTLQENENLREVVSRLQSENMRLRQSSFTFSVPHSTSEASTSQTKEAGPSRVGSSDVQQHDAPMNLFSSTPSTTTSSTTSTHDSPESLYANENNDGQLPFLGQNVFSFNNSGQQQTATSDAMNLDLGFGPVLAQTPYTTIASNPLFMSFREPDMFDAFAPQSQNQNGNHGHNHSGVSQNGQSFDFSQNLFPGWPDVSMNGVAPNSMQAFDLTNSLDELFGAYNNNNGSGAGLDYSINAAKTSPSDSLSPVSHQKSTAGASSSGSSSSPSSSDSSPSATGSPDVSCRGTEKKTCSKQDIAQAIAQDAGSVFAPPNNSKSSSTPRSEDSRDGESCDEFPPCKGLQLPKTQRSDKNVEVMNAWRKIRQDPKFQDADINQLCSEFASKARCDGCHVVIEPTGMQEILESVQQQKRAKQQSRLFSASDAFATGLAGVTAIGSQVNSLTNPLNK